MPEIADGSIQLMVTSPPYPMIQMWDEQFTKGNRKVSALWRKLDRGDDQAARQIYDLMHENLSKVWAETYRVLADGAIAAINIGDATRSINGNFQLFPNHARITEECEKIGFTTLPYILWKKPTNRPKYKGKGAFLGSGFLPPNAYVTLDCEFILIFKKPGPAKRVPPEVKEASRLTKEEWKEYFAGHWHFAGARQQGHEAMFPEELPRRLIRMFTFPGDTVLDPFLGSGTTAKVALELGRNCLGYEINENCRDIIEARLGPPGELRSYEIIHPAGAHKRVVKLPEINYNFQIENCSPLKALKVGGAEPRPHKVTNIVDGKTLRLDNGELVGFLGVQIKREAETRRYLQEYVLGKNVIVKYDAGIPDRQKGYVYLKNKILINSYLVKSGLGDPDIGIRHKHQSKFVKLWQERSEAAARQSLEAAGQS